MSKSEEINAELTKLGITFDPDAHWKTREMLLNNARETLEGPTVPNVAAIDPKPLTGTIAVVGEVAVAPPPAFAVATPPAFAVATTDPEPMGAVDAGDKDPVVIEWRRRNWPADKFAKKYPNA